VIGKKVAFSVTGKLKTCYASLVAEWLRAVKWFKFSILKA
jgi:hypothetical protein